MQQRRQPPGVQNPWLKVRLGSPPKGLAPTRQSRYPGRALPPVRQGQRPPAGIQGRVAPPSPRPGSARLPARKPASHAGTNGRLLNRPYLWLVGLIAGLALLSCAALTLGLGVVYAGGILPGVSAGGVALGGLSRDEAADKLREEWQAIIVTDGQQSWRFNPADLGITLDAEATARAAFEAGRGDLGRLLPGLIGRVNVAPVVNVDFSAAEAALNQYAGQFETPATNAGVRLVNGRVEATPAASGRALDVAATLNQLRQDAGDLLADGRLDVVTRPVPPTITDATPMVEQATRLLSSPLEIRVYDPVTGDSVYWSVAPEQWATWLTTAPVSSINGVTLTADPMPVRAYLEAQAGAALDSSRYLKLDEVARDVQNNIQAGRPAGYARVYHRDRQHVVQAGETITSIAWDYGVPYLYIQEANGGLSSVSVGQTITIPSPDNFLPYPVVPDKRIVVSISQQRVRAYENGQVKWDWIASTGIPDSPTWPGIYQVISHDGTAYAGNWNLWMPNFLGVYQPIPNADFTNGFHGFPTRGGSQLLWTGDLGRRVTYGCILLSSEDAALLYDWAEEGVVVEIQP